jgi:hypothetical protein
VRIQTLRPVGYRQVREHARVSERGPVAGLIWDQSGPVTVRFERLPEHMLGRVAARCRAQRAVGLVGPRVVPSS